MFAIDDRIARYTWSVIAILLILGILYRIRETLFVFTVAVLFAVLLSPLIELLNRHIPGRSRTPALAIVYLLLIGLLIFGLFEIGSRVVVEARTLTDTLPQIASKLQNPKGLPAAAPGSIRMTIFLEIRKLVVEHSQQIFSFMPTAALKVFAVARSLFFVVLVPILSFFFLNDAERIREFIVTLAPDGARRTQLQELGADLHVLLAQYVRALVVLAGFVFGAYALFFFLIKVPYSMLLAAIEFPLEFIPIVGPSVGFVIIMLVSAFSGYRHLIVLVAFMAIFRIFQDYAVSPRFMSGEMKLHPLVIIFGVLAGAQLGGIIGCFLSVPVIAALRIVYVRLRRRRLVVPQEPAVTVSR
ncbi:MAG TPA: AI-2E family transporter [Terriglobia bacterium]|nr:AI-2E family transporter [Terriglobia bacterium]